METFGKIIFGIGVVMVVVGLILWQFGGYFGWLGNLPGDIRIEREGFSFYAPITTMIIISVVLSIIISLISRLFR